MLVKIVISLVIIIFVWYAITFTWSFLTVKSQGVVVSNGQSAIHIISASDQQGEKCNLSANISLKVGDASQTIGDKEIDLQKVKDNIANHLCKKTKE